MKLLYSSHVVYKNQMSYNVDALNGYLGSKERYLVLNVWKMAVKLTQFLSSELNFRQA